jgi:hypothetical protein
MTQVTKNGDAIDVALLSITPDPVATMQRGAIREKRPRPSQSLLGVDAEREFQPESAEKCMSHCVDTIAHVRRLNAIAPKKSVRFTGLEARRYEQF